MPTDLPQAMAGLTALLHASIATQHQVIQSAQIHLEQFKRREADLIQTQRDADAKLQEAQRDADARLLGVQRAADSGIQSLLEQIALSRHRQFGASSETLSAQARLFDEAEVLAATSIEEQDQVNLPAADVIDHKANTPATGNKPAGGKRAPLPAELPRIEIIHDVPETQRTCPCGTPMALIGEDVSEQLDIVPMQIRVLRHIRKRYGCAASSHAPIVAALPAQPLPKSNASASLLAMLLTVKYGDGLPLTRFAKVLARHGVTVPDQTLVR